MSPQVRPRIPRSRLRNYVEPRSAGRPRRSATPTAPICGPGSSSPPTLSSASPAPPHRGPAPSLGTTRRTPSSHPRPGAAGVSQRPRDGGSSVGRTETVQARPGTASRLEEQAAGHTTRRRQDGQTRRVDQGTPSPPRINAKLTKRFVLWFLLDSRSGGAISWGVAPLVRRPAVKANHREMDHGLGAVRVSFFIAGDCDAV